MLYRTYGSTGIKVSALGFGCMRFATPKKTDQMAEVIWHAFQKGINYFDTAPYYCEDRSESIVGAAVPSLRKSGKPFYLSTKCSSGDPTLIRQQCERSLQRLNVDRIDFYHVWCLIQPDEFSKRKAQGAIDAFLKLKEEGLIRHICVSTHLEYDHLERLLDQTEGLFDGLLVGINLLNYSLRSAGMKAAFRKGMAVVTMNTLGGGLLTKYSKSFLSLTGKNAPTMLDSALQFNLSLPEVSCALVGFRNKADVDSALQSLERFTPMTAEEIRAKQEIMSGKKADFCTRCGYCRECPEGIPVVRLMDTFNSYMLAGSQEAQNHLQWHWGISNLNSLLQSCTRCGHCEEKCTQHLPILERFEQMKSGLSKKG